MHNKLVLGVVGALLLMDRAAADSPFPTALGASLSTLGPGAALTVALQPNVLTAELDAAFIAYSHSVSSDGSSYRGTDHFLSVGLLGNVYPFGGAFHLTAGAYYLDQHLPLDVRPQVGDYRINGQSYPQSELTSLSGRVVFVHEAPYLGIGWGNPTMSPGWHLSGRLGVLYEGKPRVDVVGVTTLTGAQRDALYNNLDVQRRRVQNDLSFLAFYPVAGISVDYRF
jgi:hypothetical protein